MSARPSSRPSKPNFDKFMPRDVDPEAEQQWLAGQAKREAEERRDRRKLHLDTAASALELTDTMRDALIDQAGLVLTPSLEAAKGWLGGHPKPCLVLAGGTGCGKSVSAAWILAQEGGVWLSAERAVRIFSASFGAQWEQQEQLRVCRMLYLDDVGTESDRLRMLHVLIELLESRKSQRRRTVITTNLPVKGFVERYKHERLSSRMSESVFWHGSKGADLRRR